MTIVDIVQRALTARVLEAQQAATISQLMAEQAYDHLDMVFLERLRQAVQAGEVSLQ
ncbi:MAG: hypothetical protein Q6J68_02990 [Thermostichales cyanobacterium SZTDM-1c_bins_54]